MRAAGILAATIIYTHAGPVPAAAQDTTAQIERGKQVYTEQRCQLCHSVAGTGNRRYPLDGVGRKLTAEQIRKWIVAPQEMNPKVRKRAYDKLLPSDLEALVVYLQRLRKPR